ncbi:ABC transporter substrate-binding protein [Amycolatopsis sp. H20-H5]|uniref:ABC transporter substrate-binding protein n=1 Tax=Amycolatopsis sp. H20-H5 TaxID=3046309 RepID=UPI002DBA7147|nr:extracellular solute-binding protein [Amycolatopsis sp. H20-H5]MEC3981808.1 extracellular solute-binding protein [Amycolatopsis sp. H20-H5]
MFSNRRIPVLAALAALVPLALAACGGGADSSGADPSGPVTLTWWHNGTADPLKSIWEQVAADYHQAHPEVTIKGQPLQNEEFTTKVPLALQSNEPPDVYQAWGGGEMASQVTSGKVADVTGPTKGWLAPVGKFAEGWQADGKQYGVPFEQHIVGFWYRKDLFAKAGVTTPPSTMDELNSAVAKLKTTGVAPIAVGGKDRWPDAFYWNYFAVRECTADALKQAVKAVKLEDPCWTKAGQDLKAFLATQPFQTGFVGTPAQQGAGSSAGLVANGKAAMELQGDWEPGTMSSLTEDKALDSKIGWFPFPAVPGGAGDPAAVLGGGDGFSCTTRAAKACADFLQYLGSEPVQTKIAAQGAGLPVNPAAAKSLKTETLKGLFDYGRQAPYLQMYFDKAFPTAVGAALNDAVANFFAGQGSPEGIVAAVNQAAAGNK